MIVFDRKEKEIKVPEGLGNINLTVVDANLEDKTVEINEVETTILPSSGYNGMSSLQIDAQPVYDNGYSQGENIGYNSGYTAGDADGYNRGYNEGETAQKAKLTGITITENGTYSREDGYDEVVVEVPDLNGDYSEGYDAGKVDGYDSGYTAGEVEQKSKLTNITISENGTYSREDGYNEVIVDIIPEPIITFPLDVTLTENGTYNYDPTENGDGYSSVKVIVDVPDLNGSYDEGYQAGIEEGTANAGEIIAQTARVLNITENGTYTSEYSQWGDYPKPEQVTGVFDDGKEFFDYVELNDNLFFIEKYVTNNSKLECWFKPLTIPSSYIGYILGNGANDNSKFGLYLEYSIWNLYFGGNTVRITLERDKWYHIVLSQEGAFVNNEKIGEYNITEFLSDLNIKIGFFNNFKHSFGMIKLDGDVYIPTENGFINYATGSLLQTYNSLTSTNYIYTNNFTEPIAEGNLIRTVNVDVQPKINVAETGLKFGYSTFTTIPDFYVFEGITDVKNMFRECNSLQTIPLIDTSKVTDMYYMFGNCGSLQTIPLIDTSNVTNMNYMFGNCGSLQTIPELDTRNVTNMNNMFFNCGSLQTIPELDTRNVTNMGYMFQMYNSSSKLISLPKIYCDSCTNIATYFQGTRNYLTDVGGWINLKINWNDNNGLKSCPNLTYQSCINVLNGLYDFTGNGETPASNQGQLKVHQNFLDLVGDEISIGTNKGWTITA